MTREHHEADERRHRQRQGLERPSGERMAQERLELRTRSGTWGVVFAGGIAAVSLVVLALALCSSCAGVRAAEDVAHVLAPADVRAEADRDASGRVDWAEWLLWGTAALVTLLGGKKVAKVATKRRAAKDDALLAAVRRGVLEELTRTETRPGP